MIYSWKNFTNIIKLFTFVQTIALRMNRPVTINDIAKQLNISASTVSRALQDNKRISISTRETVKKLAGELNYQPNIIASSLRKGKGNTIGVICPRINRNFFAGVIDGIEQVANTYNFNVLISQTHEKVENEIISIASMINSRVDGIIMSLSASTRDYTHVESALTRGIPVIFFDRVCEDLVTSSVVLDDFTGAYEVVSHMIMEGCQRIAYFNGPDHVNVYRQRKAGYEKALTDHGLQINEQLLFTDVLTREQGIQVTGEMLKKGFTPDGIFAASDFSALGAILRLREEGLKIPADIAVAGFANEPFTSIIDPPMTTVEQFSSEIGRQAAEIYFDLHQAENQDKKPVQKMIRPELIIRNSTLKNKNLT